MKIFKDKGITPLAIGEKDSWTGSFLFMNILLRTNGGPGFLQDVMDGKKTFEDPAFIEAVDAIPRAGSSRCLPRRRNFHRRYNAGGNIFKSGKAAMWVIGSWETGAIDASSVAG